MGSASVSSMNDSEGLGGPSSLPSTDSVPHDSITALEAIGSLKHKRSKSVPPLVSSRAATSNRRLSAARPSLKAMTTGRKVQESQQSLSRLQKERQEKLVAELNRIRSVLRRVVSKMDNRNGTNLQSLSGDITATSKAQIESRQSWPDVAVSKSKFSYGERGLQLFQRSNQQLAKEDTERSDSNISDASSPDAANESHNPYRAPPSSVDTSASSEGKHAAMLESLRAQLEEQMIANSFRIADGVYLEQQLVEKSRALDQCLAVVELCEKQQAKLTEENRILAEEGTRLRRILQNGDYETF